MSPVCLAINDQIFIFGVNKSGAGPFSLDGLASNGRSVGLVCVQRTGLLGFCALFSGCEVCLVLWSLLPPEELDGIIPRNHVLALEIFKR